MGDDIAFGGDGSETFFGDGGHNFIDGGAGADTLKFAFRQGYQYGVAITIDLRNTQEQQVNTTGHISWYTVRNVENLIGNGDDDCFTGSDAANVFIGAAGNDMLDGQGGNDMLNGGAGSDKLFGGEGSDIAVFTGRYADYTITRDNDGLVTIRDNRAPGDGVDVLTRVEFAMFSDMLFTLPTRATAAADTAAGPLPEVKHLKLSGGRSGDALIGGKGNDNLNGGQGRDKLTGSAGMDVFAFTTKLRKGNVDTITDFHAPEDTIVLSKKVFTKLQKGVLKKGAFHIGAQAKDKSDRIVFDSKTGDLFYDQDGSGRKQAVKFAELSAGAALTAADFLVI